MLGQRQTTNTKVNKHLVNSVEQMPTSIVQGSWQDIQNGVINKNIDNNNNTEIRSGLLASASTKSKMSTRCLQFQVLFYLEEKPPHVLPVARISPLSELVRATNSPHKQFMIIRFSSKLSSIGRLKARGYLSLPAFCVGNKDRMKQKTLFRNIIISGQNFLWKDWVVRIGTVLCFLEERDRSRQKENNSLDRS